MNIVFIFTSILFFISIFKDICHWISVWQLNQFRFGLLINYFSKSEYHKEKNRFNNYVKIILFLLYFIIIFNDTYLNIYQYAILIFYIFQVFTIIKSYLSHTLSIPVSNFRVNLILFLTLSIVVLFYNFPLLEKYFWLLFIDLSVPILVGIFVFLFSFPTEIYSDWQIAKAAKRIRTYPNLIVIAVAGNKGKRETIQYIRDILHEQFKVITTDQSDSNTLNLIRTIHSKLTYDTEIFIADVNGFEKGEIKGLCELLQPQIGIITALHSNSSSSRKIEKLKKIHFELIESLPKTGLSLFNGNNKNTYNLYKKTKRSKSLYLSGEYKNVTDEKYKNDIVAFNVKKMGHHIAFDLQSKGKQMHVALHSIIDVEYILPAIYVALSLGMSKEDLRKALSKLK